MISHANVELKNVSFSLNTYTVDHLREFYNIQLPWSLKPYITSTKLTVWRSGDKNSIHTYPKKFWVHIYSRRYSCNRPSWINWINTYIHSIQLFWRKHLIPCLTQLKHLSPCFLIHLYKGITLLGTVPYNKIILPWS